MSPPLFMLVLGSAFGSPADQFGFGGKVIGQGGGGVAQPGHAGAALTNPAALAGQDHAQIAFGYALVRYHFDDLPPIWWDTNRDGLVNDSDTPLNLNEGYDPADGTMFAISRPFSERLGFGFSLFAPQSRMVRLHTIEPSIPNYFMYENRAHKYELAVALGGTPVRGLHLGAGVRVISKSVINVALTVDATVAGEPEDESTPDDLVAATVDVHDLGFDLIPTVVPVLGLRWDVGEHIEALKGLSVGASYHGTGGIPVEVNIDAQVNGHAEDIGDLSPVTAALNTQLQILIFDHYLPRQAQLGVAYNFRDRADAYLDVQHTLWQAMQLNVTRVTEMAVQSALADLSEFELTDGNDVSDVSFRNTTSLRAGLGGKSKPLPLPEGLAPAVISVRGGFGYEPSPLVSQSAETAFLDSDRLIFAGGASFDHSTPTERFAGPMHWDLFFQYHLLASGVLQRPAQDAPRAGYPVDNAPVPIGGGFFATGLQWSLDY